MTIENTRIANIQAQIFRGDIHKSKGAEKIAKLRRQASKIKLEESAEKYVAGGVFTTADMKARGLQSTRCGRVVRI